MFILHKLFLQGKGSIKTYWLQGEKEIDAESPGYTTPVERCNGISIGNSIAKERESTC